MIGRVVGNRSSPNEGFSSRRPVPENGSMVLINLYLDKKRLTSPTEENKQEWNPWHSSFITWLVIFIVRRNFIIIHNVRNLHKRCTGLGLSSIATAKMYCMFLFWVIWSDSLWYRPEIRAPWNRAQRQECIYCEFALQMYQCFIIWNVVFECYFLPTSNIKQ
jgi:hypothetical protein